MRTLGIWAGLLGGVLLAGCSIDTSAVRANADVAVNGEAGEASTDVAPVDAAGDVASEAAGDAGADVQVDVAPEGSLAGFYRLTSLVYTADGGSVAVHDTDTSLGLYHERVNGTMSLTSSSYSFSLAVANNMLTGSDHVPANMSMGTPPSLNASGYGYGGTLDPLHDRFIGPTYMCSAAAVQTFMPNADGTLTDQLAPGVQLIWTPAVNATLGSTFTSGGIAVGAAPVPNTGVFSVFVRPRAIIAWDKPNRGAGYLFPPANDVMLTWQTPPPASPISAPYSMSFTDPPPVTATVGGIDVAIGYVLIYDATSQASTWSGNAVLRGVSTIAIAWRGTGTPDATYATSAVADLQSPGYQLVTVHPYITNSMTPTEILTVTPLDSTNPIPLDAPVFEDAIAMGQIPDLL